MGGTLYSFNLRSARAEEKGYFTKAVEDTFTQIKEGKIHESMNPRFIRLRESRDSTIHPNSFPIVFCMDVTGSMKRVPHMLIKDGLPKMVTTTIQKGVESPAILFVAVGDSQAGDNAPLQIGQFESGDLEMDTWLERTWPEGGGGGNIGESYLWFWYFLAYHTATDAWDKRKERGLAVSFGDEPCLAQITRQEYEEVMGNNKECPGLPEDLQFPLKAENLLARAQERWNVFHIHFTGHRPTPSHWKSWLGQHLIEVQDHTEVPDTVAELAVTSCSYCGKAEPGTSTSTHTTDYEDEVL